MLFDGLTDPNPHVADAEHVFRYMTSDGLRATIASRTLRMNAWSKMNDPREANKWESTGTLRAAGGYSETQMYTRIGAVAVYSFLVDLRHVGGSAHPSERGAMVDPRVSGLPP